MKTNAIALAAVWILTSASPASAATSSSSLTTGGRTLAGPGNTKIAIGMTTTVYTHPSPDKDVCATVINGSKSSAVRITLVDDSTNEMLLELAAGVTGALCDDSITRMDLSCLGETACTTSWRVDAK